MAEERTYTARGLMADDIFLCIRIINKIGIRELKECMRSKDVVEAMASAMGGSDEEISKVGMAVMMELASVILTHLPDCKNEIYALLAALYETSPDEVAKLPSGVFTRMVMDVLKKEEFRDFFTDVFGLFRQET
jgi:hypothetical protein